MACSCDLTGYTERETLINSVRWAASWLRTITKRLKSARELIAACNTTITTRNPKNIDDKCSAVDMMLSGFLKSYREEFIEDDGVYNKLDNIVNSAEKMCDLGGALSPINVHSPRSIKPTKEVNAADHISLEHHINAIMKSGEAINTILAKYTSNDEKPAVQINMKFADPSTGRPVVVEGLDPVPILNRIAQAKQKAAATAEALKSTTE